MFAAAEGSSEMDIERWTRSNHLLLEEILFKNKKMKLKKDTVQTHENNEVCVIR